MVISLTKPFLYEFNESEYCIKYFYTKDLFEDDGEEA